MIFLHLAIPWHGRKNFYLRLHDEAELRRWAADLRRRALERSSNSELRRCVRAQSTRSDPTLSAPRNVVIDVTPALTAEEVRPATNLCSSVDARRAGAKAGAAKRATRAGAASTGGRRVLSSRATNVAPDDEQIASQVFGKVVVYTPRGLSGTRDGARDMYSLPQYGARGISLSQSAREAGEARRAEEASRIVDIRTLGTKAPRLACEDELDTEWSGEPELRI